MPSDNRDRGRKKPEDSDDDDIDDLIPSENVEVKFRSCVQKYGEQAEYPKAPLYAVGEIVYLAVSGQSHPAGPYVIVSISMDRYYTIKRSDNGEAHSSAVAEARLLIRTS